MKKLLDLFITFFKIGLFTFGGGYAMISIIENECVSKKHWINKEEMQEIIVISESSPGPIAINSSTFIGYKVSKILGSVIATIGVSLPSLIIITLISMFLINFQDNLFITTLFEAIRASVIFLMVLAFFKLSKNANKDIIFYALLLSSFILKFFFNVKSIYIIIFSILLSVGYQFYIFRKEKEVKENV